MAVYERAVTMSEIVDGWIVTLFGLFRLILVFFIESWDHRHLIYKTIKFKILRNEKNEWQLKIYSRALDNSNIRSY